MKVMRLNLEGASLGRAVKKELRGKEHLRFKLPSSMKQKIPLKMVEDGYGLKEKSLWLADAISMFLADPYWQSMALESNTLLIDLVNDGVYLDRDHLDKLEDAAKKLAQYSDREGRPVGVSRAAIIRAAINSKFM